MRILGIDYGDQRIGLALSDFTGTLVGRAWTLHEWNLDRAIEAIAAVVKENEVGRLVLGLPKNMDGSEGPRAEKSRAVAARLTESASHRSDRARRRTLGRAAQQRGGARDPACKRQKRKKAPRACGRGRGKSHP